MDSTLTYAGIAIVAVIVLVAFLFVAKRILRLAVRLMLVALFVCALLAAGGWGWWNGWFGRQSTPPPARPAATPRRSSR
jgi:hypothetical protein